MLFQQGFNGLDFDDDAIFDQKIDIVFTHDLPVVYDFNRCLRFGIQA